MATLTNILEGQDISHDEDSSMIEVVFLLGVRVLGLGVPFCLCNLLMREGRGVVIC
jgi:hypothetical protein